MTAAVSDRGPVQVDLGKLLLIAIMLVGATVLGAMEIFDATVTAGLYVSVVSYLFGNGVVAIRGRRPVGVVSTAPEVAMVEKADEANDLLTQVVERLERLEANGHGGG